MTIYDPEDQAERRHLETRLHHLIPLDDAVSLQTRPREHFYLNSRAGGVGAKIWLGRRSQYPRAKFLQVFKPSRHQV
jgi:hypothetical protein